MSDTMKIAEPNVIRAQVLEDQGGGWGLYVVPDKAEEICITEAELRAALAHIEANR